MQSQRFTTSKGLWESSLSLKGPMYPYECTFTLKYPYRDYFKTDVRTSIGAPEHFSSEAASWSRSPATMGLGFKALGQAKPETKKSPVWKAEGYLSSFVITSMSRLRVTLGSSTT